MPFGWGRVSYMWDYRSKWLELPFPVSEYEQRIDKIRKMMEPEKIDCLLVHGNRADRAAVRYLANFEDFYGGDSVVVIPAREAVGMATNAIMHGEPMHSGIQQVWMEDVRCAAHPRTVDKAWTIWDQLEDMLKERGLAEATYGVSGDYADDVVAFIRERFPKAKVKKVTGLLPRAMAIKSRLEVEQIRKACAGADAALTAVMENCKPGVSEYELAGLANEAMFRLGAEETAFPIAMSSGPRAGFKHTAPTDRKLQLGDLVYTDLGCRVGGYYSDCSRNRAVGEPTKEQRHFMEANVLINEACMAAARPGAVIGDIAKIAIEVAKENGYEDYLYFRGHGIGTTTHVPPSFFPGNPAKLEENMVFCFEPMLVKKEFGTGCVEDIYRVTKDGVENLNKCPARWW
ncbi:MAG: aminopeptidase P family protein [Bacillota bacterium]|nr:MAG: aminopeptidase P family protein [Bacillota bacterium]